MILVFVLSSQIDAAITWCNLLVGVFTKSTGGDGVVFLSRVRFWRLLSIKRCFGITFFVCGI